MAQSTRTISFRIPEEIKREIEEIAKTNGQSDGAWVRELTLQRVFASSEMASAQPTCTQPSLDALDARLAHIEQILTNEIGALKAAIQQASTDLKSDLRVLAQLQLDVQELLEQQVAAATGEFLDAIDRLKASQRSHKDTLVRAICSRQNRRGGY